MSLDALHDALNGDGTFWKKKANHKAVAREMPSEVLENATLTADPEGATDNAVQFVVSGPINTFATGD